MSPNTTTTSKQACTVVPAVDAQLGRQCFDVLVTLEGGATAAVDLPERVSVAAAITLHCA